jgi:hypothetical protein
VVILAPELLGETIRATAQSLVTHERKVSPAALLYAEKAGGFSCRTCCYATAVNQTHGKCLILTGTIALDTGCCAAWEADKAQLHLYHAPDATL